MGLAPAAFCAFCIVVGLTDAGFSTPPHRLADKEFLSKQTKVVDLLSHVGEPDIDDNLTVPFSLEENAERFQEPALAQRLAVMYSRGFLAGRGQTFSIYHRDDIEQARAMVDLLLSAKDFDTFCLAATWAKQRLSEALFSYAFTVAVLRRNDTMDVVLPAPYELWPHYFVGSDVLRRAYDAHLRGADADGEKPQVVEVASGDQRQMAGCPEELVSYFREDVGLNAHWAMKHFRCPFWLPGAASTSSCDRRGELFYFVLRQLAARYDLERLSAGLEPVQPLQYPTVYQDTYHSEKRFSSELGCAAEGEMFLPDTPHVWTLKTLEERICDAIDAGYVVDRNYTEHSLRSPEAIEILGNIIEGNADSLNENFYGSLYRGLLTAFRHSEGAFPAKQVPTFMENPATALRDPLFYRVVKKLLEIFSRFQDRLGPYRREELEFLGVRVESVSVKPLSTHLERFEFELDTALPALNSSSRPRLLARQRRLTARPFQYQVAVASQRDAAVDALLRVYLGPRRRPGQLDRDRHRFLLFDAFRASCKLALKKWSQTRDSWMKSVKKHHEQKTSTFHARPSRLYLYHEQMSFLNKVIETSIFQDNCYEQESSPRNFTNEASKTAQAETYQYISKPETLNNYGAQRKRKSDFKNEPNVKMTFSDNPLCIEHCGCRHMAFFNSLLPSLSLLDDGEILKFQSEVLSVLQNIKRKRRESD